MKRQTFFSVLIGVVAALLLVGGGAWFWLLTSSPLNLIVTGGQPSPSVAMFVPKQAPAMVSLLVNPEKLESFRLAVAPPGERKRAQQELAQIKQGLLVNLGLDYEQDVLPWIGDEITLAVTNVDVDRDSGNGLQPGYLLAIATDDPVRSREFLQVFWQKRAIAGANLVFEQYAGVKVIYGDVAQAASPPASATQRANAEPTSEFSQTPTLATAVVGDRFVMFANYPKILREAINNAQAPGLSLSNSPAYQRALSRLPQKQIGFAFVDLPALGAWLDGQPLTADPAEIFEGSDRLYEGLVMAFQLDRGGLLGETALLPVPGKQLTSAQPLLNRPTDALKFIPAESMASASGTHLNQVWQEIEAGLAGYDTLNALVDQPLTWLKQQLGESPSRTAKGLESEIDFATDVVGWVTKDYAIGLLPSDRPQPDWVFVAKQTPETAEALAEIDAIALRQGYSTGALMIGEQEVTAWSKLAMATSRSKRRQADTKIVQANIRGVRAQVDDYEILATSLDALDRALKANSASILTNSDFQAAIAPIASANNGYLYLDWDTVRDPLERQFPILKLVEAAGKPIFEHLQSLTISSYGNQTNLRRGAVFIRLKNS